MIGGRVQGDAARAAASEKRGLLRQFLPEADADEAAEQERQPGALAQPAAEGADHRRRAFVAA